MTTLGLHHIGFTVPDMDAAINFFTTAFGAETVMECGSVDVDDTFMQRRLGVPNGCKIVDQRVIQTGRGGSLELFQYSGAQGAGRRHQDEQRGRRHAHCLRG